MIYINGKFTARRTTGVERVALGQVQALDRQVAPGAWTLLCPPLGRPPALRNIAVRHVGPTGWPLHLWEQLALPWAARGGWLLNLAGSAPALARHAACMVHDAAVWDHPEAYTPAFVRWYRWLFRWLARRGAVLLTVSRFSQQRLAASLGRSLGEILVVPNGGDHLANVAADERVLDHHGLRGRRWLLGVASDNPTKELRTLRQAFARLAEPDLRLVLVGGRNSLVFAGVPADPSAGVHDPAADPRVLALGPVDDVALVALYRHAVALVFPSRYEGFGLPPLEAMGLGCPVVAARAGALPEVCGDAALWVAPGDAPGLAAALRTLLDDAGLRERLRDAGARQASRFRWAGAATALRAALQSRGVPA